MDAQSFFELERLDDVGHRWRMPITPRVSSGLGALFGGCGLGAAIEALEQATGRPLVWAAGQFLSFARPPAVLDLHLDEVVRGRQVSQARVVGRVDGSEIFTVNASLGARDVPFDGEWATPPQVPEPDDCPPRAVLPHMENTIASRLDVRLAKARDPASFPQPASDGNSVLWIRLPELLELSAAALAIVGDFVPFGIGQALGERAGGNSLDNTLRIARRAPTEWVLADIRVHAVHGGFGHGVVYLWSYDRTLLGTASQSTIVRQWRDHGHEHDAQEHETSGEGR